MGIPLTFMHHTQDGVLHLRLTITTLMEIKTNLETKYTDWNNTHFLEARLQYDYKGFYLMTGYTIAGGGLYNIKR